MLFRHGKFECLLHGAKRNDERLERSELHSSREERALICGTVN